MLYLFYIFVKLFLRTIYYLQYKHFNNRESTHSNFDYGTIKKIIHSKNGRFSFEKQKFVTPQVRVVEKF